MRLKGERSRWLRQECLGALFNVRELVSLGQVCITESEQIMALSALHLKVPTCLTAVKLKIPLVSTFTSAPLSWIL